MTVLQQQRGFTLTELMISLAIMAFISAFTAQAIRDAARNKVNVQNKIDQTSMLRDAVQVMMHDIENAFHYRDLNIELYNAAQKEREKRAADKTTPTTPDKNANGGNEDETETPTAPAEPATPNATPKKPFEPKKQRIITHFVGEKDSLHFTTLSHIRSAKDELSSDQAEVGYLLRQCTSRSDANVRSQCLWRRVSPIIDDEVTEGGTETVLLENVSRFELGYLGPETEEEYIAVWKTDENGDSRTQGQFPYAIEITLEILEKDKGKERKIGMTVVAPIRFPNNLAADGENKNGPQAAPGSPLGN